MAPQDASNVETLPLGLDSDAIAEEQLQSFTKEELQERIDNYRPEKQRFDVSPTSQQLLGTFTVFCLIMNRTIASGIFTQPVAVLTYSGSSGVAILLWVLGGLIVWAVVVCWLELALTIPLHYVFHNDTWLKVSAPRSGGDKNYLEYIFKRPRRLATCVFGIVFIVFGNLAGNAIQFGVFMQTAIDPASDEKDGRFNKPAVLGWAIAVLTLSALINVLTRRLAILLNNVFAVCKVGMLVAVVFIGLIYGSTHGHTCQNIAWKNQGAGGGFGDIVIALFYAMYPYTGFEQPFYVLAEVDKPKQKFAPAVNVAMLVVMILYPLANVSFLCVVPYINNDKVPVNIAISFFGKVSGAVLDDGRNPVGEDTSTLRAVAAMLAVFIFGNIVAQTYTASRVKQEIAKEGILPWSLPLATGNNTLLSRLRPSSQASKVAIRDIDSHLEQTPMAATLLHWVFEVLLVLVFGIPLVPSKAYAILTFLYTYSIVGVLGLLTIGGLLYLKMDSWIRSKTGRKWHSKVKWRPWFDPLPVVLGTLSLAFLLFAVFVPPSVLDPDVLQHWIGPLIGCGITFLGVAWWLGLHLAQWKGRWTLVTRRVPYIEIEADGTAREKAEFVEYERVPNVGS